MKLVQLTTRLVSALSAVFLPSFAFAVTPPPDGGYPNRNTAEGEDALFNLTTGAVNTAVGFHALYFTTTGNGNAATGNGALQNNTTGSANTADGAGALLGNTTGFSNTGLGGGALEANTSGFDNSAVGSAALCANRTGTGNTALGKGALESNTIGNENCALGDDSLQLNKKGGSNTALGSFSLGANSVGNSNTAVGGSALFRNQAGSNNIGLGFLGGQKISNGSNNISIANDGASTDSGTIRIGTTGTQTSAYIAGISGVTVAGGVGVVIASNGQLGVTTSSARYKEAIKPMKEASESILSLKPVTFRYKKELDPEAIPQFGLVAEQVAKVDPDLVARDESGKPYTVRYEAVNAMLLNEFLKEHRKGQKQDETIAALQLALAEQQREIKALAATVKEQAAQVRKVSDQFEKARPGPQVVAEN